MKRKQLSRKIRQLKFLRKKLKAHQDGKTPLSKNALETLCRKTATLFKKVRFALRLPEVRKLATTFGLAFLLSGNPVDAQTFAVPVIDPFGLDSSLVENEFILDFADYDGDGDLDIMKWFYNYNTGATNGFVENNGTPEKPQFTAPVDFQIGNEGMDLIYPVDIDGDGDIDLISAGYDDYSNSTKLLYAENTGNAQAPQYPNVVSNDFGFNATDDNFMFPSFSDLDNDGDLDAIVLGEEIIEFRENLGTAQSPQFGTPETLDLNIPANTYFITPDLVDLDMDGDQDLIISGYMDTNGIYDPKIYYSENIGTATAPEFSDAIENPFGFDLGDNSLGGIPMFADFDNDGDEDLMVLNIDLDYRNSFIYYENISMVSTNSQNEKPFDIFPNPTSDFIYFETEAPIQILRIFDASGKKVLENRNPNNSQSLAALSDGLYTVRVDFEDGSRSISRITKQ